MQRWKLINDILGIGQPEPAETYSTSEHLFTDLAIPPGVTGTLPRELRGARAGLAAEVEEDLGETGSTRSRKRSPGGRSRSRSRSRKSGGHAGGAADHTAAPATTESAADGSAEAESRAPRRRRRTRGGHEVARDAVAETGPTESAQQAS